MRVFLEKALRNQRKHCTWLNLLVASTASLRILSVGAFRALNFIVFENKLLVGQRMVTLVAAKARVVPIAALVMELLNINKNASICILKRELPVFTHNIYGNQ